MSDDQDRPKLRRSHAFTGGPNVSRFMRWFIRCMWAALILIGIIVLVAERLAR